MPSPFRLSVRPVLAALPALALLAGLGTEPAQADRLRDRAAADSFGNLVVWSRSGYKRIVVGQGHLAAKLNDYVAGAPDRPAPEEIPEDLPPDLPPEAYSPTGDAVRDEQRRRMVQYRWDCFRAPAFVKGRSYMYGLAEGEMPVITPCEPAGEY